MSVKFQPERFRQAGDYSYIFFPCEATPLLRTDRLNANQWLKAIAGACDYQCMNTFFLHNHRAVAGVGRFVERETAPKGLSPRRDYPMRRPRIASEGRKAHCGSVRLRRYEYIFLDDD